MISVLIKLYTYPDLDTLIQDAQRKNVEIDDQEADDILDNEKEIDDKNAEFAETQDYWRKLNNDLIEVQKLLAGLTTTTSGPTVSPANAKSIINGQNKEKELEDRIKIEDANLLTLQADLVNLQNESIARESALTLVKGEYTNITNDTQAKEKEISDKETEVGQILRNIIENKEQIHKVNNINKDITRKYTDTFNMANRDRYSVQQDPNEDDQDYSNRIKTIEVDWNNCGRRFTRRSDTSCGTHVRTSSCSPLMRETCSILARWRFCGRPPLVILRGLCIMTMWQDRSSERN